MNLQPRILAGTFALILLAACATTPPAAPAPGGAVAETKSPTGQTKHKWTVATEAEVAAELDKKFQEAAKHFTKLKKDDQIMYCKRYRMIGSSLPTIQCITEAELRAQVEDSDQARDRMRQRMGKCDITVGCGAGS